MKKFFKELKRRNVIKSALAYLVVAWILQQVFTNLLPLFDAPNWILKGITIIMAIGLPIWIIVSWIYDITPQGIEKTTKDTRSELAAQATNKRLNVFIIVSLSIAVIVMGLKIFNVFTNSDKQYAIAVLFFDNINGDEADEWFSDGITKDIYTYLAAVKSLRVISTKSTIKYKDTDKSISEIANELGVNYIVEGNVRKHNKRVLISATLIKANDELEWEGRYNESEEKPFKIQQAVSQKIVKELKITLSPEEEKTIEKYPTENMEAYYLFSEGRLVMANDSREKEDLELNIELNKKAIALDPNFAEAYAEIAQSTILLGSYHTGYQEGIKKAMPYLEKALELNPNTPRALAAIGMIISSRGNWPEAQGYFEKAITASPSDATINYQYALHIRFHDANKYQKLLTKAQILDPMSAQIGHQFFAYLINNYKIEEAEKYYNKYKFLFTFKGEQIEKESILIAYKNKDWTAAIPFLENELKKDPDNAYLYRKLGEAYEGILLDYDNYIKYTMKAYRLDSTNVDNAYEYYYALIGAEKLNDAKKFLQSKNFKSLLSKGEELNLLYEYYLAKEDFEKVEEVLKDSLMNSMNFNKMFYNASVGNRAAFDSLIKINKVNDHYKAVVYAMLKEKDSMYFYLGKLEEINPSRNPNGIPRIGLRFINSWKQFNPYRKEERYKALLRKHYLPITHWNE